MGGDADGGGGFGNVFQNDGVRSDAGVVADDDGTQQFRARPDDDAVAQRRVAFALRRRRPAQRHAVVKGHVVADFGGFADDDAGRVVDEQVFADSRGGVNVDARQKTPERGQNARRRAEIPFPQAMRQTVRQNRVKSRIAQKHFDFRTRGGIAPQHGVGVFGRFFKDFFRRKLEHFTFIRLRYNFQSL